MNFMLELYRSAFSIISRAVDITSDRRNATQITFFYLTGLISVYTVSINENPFNFHKINNLFEILVWKKERFFS